MHLQNDIERFNIGLAVIYKIIHEELHRKNSLLLVSPDLTEHQKVELVRISKRKKKPLKLVTDGGHRIISKIITDDETHICFFDFLSPQECKVWVFKYDLKQTIVKKQRAMKKRKYAVFSGLQD